MAFRDLHLGTKQLLGFGLILAILSGVNIFSINTVANLKTEVDEVSSNWLPRAIALSDINLHTSNLRLNQLQHAFAENDAQKQEQADAMITLIDKINENVDTYERLKAESEMRNLYSKQELVFYTEFNRLWETYQDLSLTFFMLSRDSQTRAAVDLLNGGAQTVFTDFSIVLERLVQVNKQDALNAAQRAETTYQTTRNITIGLLIFTILMTILIAVLLVRFITVPLKHLVKAVRSVADGDIDIQLDVMSQDEVGILASSFNQMTAALRDARERARREARLRAETAELKIKATEAEARALKAENDRKTDELEKARLLQLSMLPEILPVVPNLEIAAYMKPATEVGGDYYDFKITEDKTLIVAVGDATGHGLHAGTVVAATKGLFNALAGTQEPIPFLNNASLALKEMGFRQMFMSLTLARLKNHHLCLSAAGMPHTLIFRSRTGNVEEIVLKGMPLGSFPNYPYQYRETYLESGDTVLFMSDGLPEMFNSDQEILGYETATALFKEAAGRAPKDIISHLTASAESWANGSPANDDMTFVVLKTK